MLNVLIQTVIFYEVVFEKADMDLEGVLNSKTGKLLPKRNEVGVVRLGVQPLNSIIPTKKSPMMTKILNFQRNIFDLFNFKLNR